MVPLDAHDTAEAAALSGFGENAVVALTAYTGSLAAVLLIVDHDHPTPYLVLAVRTSEGWVEGGGGDANVHWGLRDEDAGTGYLAWWTEVPSDATAARVRCKDSQYEIPARSGYVLWLRDGVSDSDADDFIEVAAVEQSGGWQRVPRDRAGRLLHERFLSLERLYAPDIDDDPGESDYEPKPP